MNRTIKRHPCLFFCVFAMVSVVFACESGPGSESELTVVEASPYHYGLWSIPGEPILYQATKVTYYLHVPSGYTADRPRALVLAISPSDSGKDMFTLWEKAAREYGFIFASPNRAGNPVRTDVRGQTVMDVLYDVQKKYAVDPGRIFLTGFSGGGRMAAGVALKFPGVFAGLAPLGGIVYNEDPGALAGLKVKHGVYMYVGEKDFNRGEAEQVKEILARANIPVALMIGPGASHAKPDADQCLEIYRWFMEREKADGQSPSR